MKIKIADIMIKAMSQTLADGDTVLHGLGSPLPALAMHLAKASHAPALVFFPVSEGLDPDTDRYRLKALFRRSRSFYRGKGRYRTD